MKMHEQLIKQLLNRSAVKAELDQIEQREGRLLDALLNAQRGAGLIQDKID